MFNGFMSFTAKYQRRQNLPRKMKYNTKEYLFVKNNQCKQLGNHQSLVPKVHLVSKYISPVQFLKLFIPFIDCSCNSPQPSNHGRNCFYFLSWYKLTMLLFTTSYCNQLKHFCCPSRILWWLLHQKHSMWLVSFCCCCNFWIFYFYIPETA